jgi:pimeloyl-ACP methyl ester carboxylesterase
MITGSGPQNRDEEVFGFKPFKLIADALTRRGIAVLRYDDRGVGKSTGSMSESTTEDFAKDALCAVKYLRTRKDIDARQIGLCGHSEGAIAAPIAADRSKDIAFLVLLAGTGVPGDTLILWQLVTLARASGVSEREIAEAVVLQHQIYDAVRTGSGWEEVHAAMGAQIGKSMMEMPAVQRQALGDSAAFVASATDAKLSAARSPWFKFFISYDPAPTLRRMHCPVLALYGELDMQVPPRVTMKPLESALKEGGNKDVTVHMLPGTNHLFQAATSGLPSEYGSLKKEFVPGFLDTLTTWVSSHVTAGK